MLGLRPEVDDPREYVNVAVTMQPITADGHRRRHPNEGVLLHFADCWLQNASLAQYQSARHSSPTASAWMQTGVAPSTAAQKRPGRH